MNHYIEIQVVHPEHILDAALARHFGLTIPHHVVVMFHCGSRGFGHQVATDYLQVFLKVMDRKYGIKILDRELACAPFDSPEGRDYFAAMQCGLNMSFANRQVILHRIREVFASVFGRSAEELGMHMVYDVAHNTAKLEHHQIEGRSACSSCIARGRHGPLVPTWKAFRRYQEVGQRVIIGGSMETGSYLSKAITGKNVQMAELGSGCVCCTLLGEFEAAVQEILATVAPDRMVVETTGVAEPDALLDIEDNIPAVRLDGVVTVADAMVRFLTGTFLFNFVAGRWEVEPFPVDETALVFIGKYLSQQQAALLEQLKTCEQ